MINIETLFFEDFCNRIWPSASDSTIPVEISCSLCWILNWARGSFHSSSGKSMAFGVRLSVVPASAHPSKPYLPPQVSVTSVQAPNIVATAFGILDHGLSGMLNDADTFSFMLILMLVFMHADGCWWRLDRVFCDALRHLLGVELASTLFQHLQWCRWPRASNLKRLSTGFTMVLFFALGDDLNVRCGKGTPIRPTLKL